MIRCKSIQRDERGKAEEVVLETPGVYGEDEDCRYLTYEETSLSGMEGTTTTIRMYGDHVTLSRQGSFLQETEYCPGTVAKSEYITPAGPVEITVSSHWHLSFWEVLCSLAVQKMKFSIIIIVSFSQPEP